MEKHKVQFPDGSVHLIEAPEGATPEQITAYGAEIYSQMKNKSDKQSYAQPNATWGEAALQSAIRNIPFGTDIQAAGASLLTGAPFAESKKTVMDYVAQSQEQQPGASFAGGLGGSVASGMALLPAKLLQGGSALARATGAAVGSGALGFGYGAQEGETVGERVGSGLVQAGIEAPMGAVGSVAADSLIYGGKALAGKARQAVNQYTRPMQTSGSATGRAAGREGENFIETLQRPLKDTPDLSIEKGYALPLTKGQATQDAGQQSLEAGAIARQYGDDARDLALQAREIQSDAAQEQLQKIAQSNISGGGEFEAAGQIYKNVKSAYQSAKQKTREAYKGLAPERISGFYIRDSVIPEIKNQGQNEEKLYTWTNFLMGSSMLDVLAKGAVIHQPLTFE